MLELYRREESSFGDEVEEKLRDWVLAHRVITVNGEQPPGLPAGVETPLLKEGAHVYAGEANIRSFLKELGREVQQSRLFQSDACYYDPDDPESKVCM